MILEKSHKYHFGIYKGKTETLPDKKHKYVKIVSRETFMKIK